MKLVILDRDGVVNEDLQGHVRSAEDWRPISGSLDAIARLNRAGYRVVVATNEPGIRRRHVTFDDLNRIHEKMHGLLSEYGGAIDAVFICLCLPSHACDCFSPRASMYHEIADRLKVSLAGLPCIGSAPRGIAAAAAAGARPILVRTGKRKEALGHGACPEGFEAHDDLAAAVDALLAAR